MRRPLKIRFPISFAHKAEMMKEKFQVISTFESIFIPYILEKLLGKKIGWGSIFIYFM